MIQWWFRIILAANIIANKFWVKQLSVSSAIKSIHNKCTQIIIVYLRVRINVIVTCLFRLPYNVVYSNCQSIIIILKMDKSNCVSETKENDAKLEFYERIEADGKWKSLFKLPKFRQNHGNIPLRALLQSHLSHYDDNVSILSIRQSRISNYFTRIFPSCIK